MWIQNQNATIVIDSTKFKYTCGKSYINAYDDEGNVINLGNFHKREYARKVFREIQECELKSSEDFLFRVPKDIPIDIKDIINVNNKEI